MHAVILWVPDIFVDGNYIADRYLVRCFLSDSKNDEIQSDSSHVSIRKESVAAAVLDFSSNIIFEALFLYPKFKNS